MQALYDFAGSHEEATFCIKLSNHEKEIPNSTTLSLSEAGITGRVLLIMDSIEVKFLTVYIIIPSFIIRLLLMFNMTCSF